MVSAVRSRPNHYEVLGVKPTATVEEITEAAENRADNLDICELVVHDKDSRGTNRVKVRIGFRSTV